MYQFSYAEIRHESGSSARERERQALEHTLEVLVRAEQNGPRSSAAIEAIYVTRTLWSVLIEDLANPENALPEELRAGLISIGLWVMRETDAIRTGKANSFRGIIDVTTMIRDGLE
jgi:flagellar biosynthesis activator protein FlaF